LIKKALKKAPEGQRRALLTKLRSLAPKDDEHLHDWVHLYLGVWIPREPHPECRAKGHVAPFTAFADAYFARSDISVWKASRGLGGKSFLLATLTLTEMLTIGASTRVLGGSGKQSQNVHEYLRGTHPDVQGKLLNAKNAPKKWVTSDTATQQKSKNGGYAEALMASQTSVRGPHPQRLRLDEVDEMDIKIFDSAMGQTLDSPTVESQTVCSSTHQHPDGTFSEVIRRAKSRGWAIFEWCYRENLEDNDGFLKWRQVEKKKKQVTDQMWEAEFEGQEPNPGNRMFTPDQMQEIFPGDPEEQDLIVAEAPFIREIVPPGGGHYYHGTDWGKSHYTVILTMIERSGGPDELAAYGMFNKMAWPEMVGLHNERVSGYGGVSAHDATGVGGVVDDYLTVDSAPFNFSSGRLELLNKYVGAGQNGGYRYPRIAPLYYAHKFLTYDHLLNRKHLPDEVAAAALAQWAKDSVESDVMIGRAV
jgi:hypothetical protein